MRYDYGTKENILRYGSAHPPVYDLSKISVPVKLYYGENDILADPLVRNFAIENCAFIFYLITFLCK